MYNPYISVSTTPSRTIKLPRPLNYNVLYLVILTASWFLRMAREVHLILKRNTLSLLGINRRDEAHWYKVPFSLLYQKTIHCFYCHIFKFLFVTNFDFYFHFYCSPRKRFVFKPKYWAVCLNIYFSFILFFFFTFLSPCPKDQFAISYFFFKLIYRQLVVR